jgi:hypothetical protein
MAMDAEVYVYTGEVYGSLVVSLLTGGGAEVPRDMVHQGVRVRVDPSITSIPELLFSQCKKLAEVELSDGVVEIGEGSFGWCDHSITKITIPNSLRRICDDAFVASLRCPVRLHDGIESIGRGAFYGCIFTNFRVPPLITIIPEEVLRECTTMFSLEIPESTRKIEKNAIRESYCLRNVAFHPYADFADYTFFDATDLQLLFGSDARIIRELRHRFDRLPIHEIVYYQSYNQGVLQNLVAAIYLRSGQGRISNQQDCLGMTPLHILACSSVHDRELYRVIVDSYPTNLITEDRWGALPLLYAFWGAAPAEIIQFLLESYQSLYPGYKFNWTMMVQTMGRTSTPKERIENLLHVNQIHFPEQPIDWEYLLEEFVKWSRFHPNVKPFQEKMHFLFICGMSARVESLTFKVWRDHITNMIKTSNFEWNSKFRRSEDNSDILHRIREKLAQFEDNFLKLKEVTSILEIVLWKMKLNEKSCQDMATQSQKKIKTDESSIRQQCRITCGADVIIGHVLPFLISVAD